MQTVEIRKPKSYRSLYKILYIILLMGILCGILVYLDMLNYFSLENIVSMILGFLVMIFVQLRFISYYFELEMKMLDLDQIGIIKDMIKNKIFGEININYINFKQKKKYYQHTKDINDRLFSQQSQQVYNCAINVLRAKNTIDNTERMKIIKEKWEIFLFKLSQFQIFLSNLNKVFKDRALSYKKFNQKISFINDEQFLSWSVLFNQRQQFASVNQKKQFNKYLQDVNCFDWMLLKKMIIDKYHNTESKVKQISTNILSQFHAFANQMRSESRQVSSDLQNSEIEVVLAKKTCKQIEDKISSINQNIQTLTKKLSQKSKESDNMQSLFNIQCDLRFSYVQLDNLQVRRTYKIDLERKSLQSQYQLCIQKEYNFQNSGIRKFNNKISNYMMNYFQKLIIPLPKTRERRVYPQELIKMSDLLIPNSLTQNYNKINELGKRMNEYKTFIRELISLLQQQARNIKKINDVIKDYERQWKSNSQFRISQEAHIETTFDVLFMSMIESFNQKQYEIFHQIILYLRQTQAQIQKKQQKKQHIMQDYHYKLRSYKLNNPNVQITNEFDDNIRQLYNFQLENKINSQLKDIFLTIIQKYQIAFEQIQQKKQYVNARIAYIGTVDPRITKMNEFKDQIFKCEREQLLREEQQNLGSNDREADENSLMIVNRLINVFSNQWRNSQFFHKLLVEQIEVSLNVKRNHLLNYMAVRYLKIHEMEPNIIECLSILSDNIFVCSFEAKINFKGKVALHIQTGIKGKNIPINVRLLVTQFVCPLKIYFTPFALGKSYMSMMSTPQLKLEYSITVSGYQLGKIPLLSAFIETFIIIKLRKKFLHPKRATIKVPLTVKNSLIEAIKQTMLFQKLFQKKKKQS